MTVSDHPPTLSLDEINRMSPRDFRRALGDVFEGSPWIAERALAARPFASRDCLHEAMVRVMREASREERLALLRAHPDLAIRAAREQTSSDGAVTSGFDAWLAEERAKGRLAGEPEEFPQSQAFRGSRPFPNGGTASLVF